MEANARTPRELFEGKMQYEIPPFQRPYVWNETDQWEPLWRDVTRVASDIVHDSEAARDETHFLGAIVAAALPSPSGDVSRRELIDGQQRMTTLQLLLDAVHDVVRQHGQVEEAEALEELIRNGSARFAKTEKRFKLCPSQTDRAGFVRAVEGSDAESSSSQSGELAGTNAGHRLVQAHGWFEAAAEQWISGTASDGEPIPPGTDEQRIAALSETLQDRLTIVAIDLDSSDDAQLIFETLNDRGTPLLSADLIKNWLFRQGQHVGADVEQWAKDWAQLDDPWWRAEVRQGGLSRPRVDLFLQYWLTAQSAEDLRSNEVFRQLVRIARPETDTVSRVDGFLHGLLADAALYRSFDNLPTSTPEGRFYARVISQFDQAVLTPVLLRLLAPRFGVPAQQRAIALLAIESWVVRRALVFLSTRSTGRVLVALLRHLRAAAPEQVGETTRAFLSRSTARWQIWPDDGWLRSDLVTRKLYGGLNQERLRAVLEQFERRLRQRDNRYDQVSWDGKPQIEHIMPQTWRPHWNTVPPLDQEAAATRDRLVHTLGNLTLVNGHLNASLSNRPWTDAEAAGMGEGGFASQGKLSLLGRFSALVLTADVTRGHPEAWTDDDILARSRELIELIIEEWPGPDEWVRKPAESDRNWDADGVGVNSDASTNRKRSQELPVVPWEIEDVKRLASMPGESILAFLDALSADSSRVWSSDDLTKDGRLLNPSGTIGALYMRITRRFGRSNGPILFYRPVAGGKWSWSIDENFAEKWRSARNVTSVSPSSQPVGQD